MPFAQLRHYWGFNVAPRVSLLALGTPCTHLTPNRQTQLLIGMRSLT